VNDFRIPKIGDLNHGQLRHTAEAKIITEVQQPPSLGKSDRFSRALRVCHH
jgi:hypothetical protein